MKNDQYCGPAGMATIGNYIKTADKSEKIDAIILHIDSPGGTVDGTSDLAEIVKNTSKPILAFADGMMGSAAMWIGSATKEIIAANNKTQAGSIGTSQTGTGLNGLEKPCRALLSMTGMPLLKKP